MSFDPEDLRKARDEKLAYFDKNGLVEEVLGGDAQGPRQHQVGGRHERQQRAAFVRSRLVARDFKDKSDRREDLFAATPPLETLKSLLTSANRERLCVLTLDVKEAHLNRVVKPEGGEHFAEAPP